jgi:hypothetical protein
VLTEVQLTAARLVGRGKNGPTICETLSISPRTLRYWKALPGFAEEAERVRQNAWQPTGEGTLLDALTATKNDGIDWVARLGAARELIRIEANRPPAEETGRQPGERRVTVYAAPQEPPPEEESQPE